MSLIALNGEADGLYIYVFFHEMGDWFRAGWGLFSSCLPFFLLNKKGERKQRSGFPVEEGYTRS